MCVVVLEFRIFCICDFYFALLRVAMEDVVASFPDGGGEVIQRRDGES